MKAKNKENQEIRDVVESLKNISLHDTLYEWLVSRRDRTPLQETFIQHMIVELEKTYAEHLSDSIRNLDSIENNMPEIGDFVKFAYDGMIMVGYFLGTTMHDGHIKIKSDSRGIVWVRPDAITEVIKK